MSMSESLMLLGEAISSMSVGGPTKLTAESVAKSEREVAHAKRLVSALSDMVTAVTYYLENAPTKGADAVQATDKAGK